MKGVLNKTLEEGNKQYPSGSSKFFSFEEGDNRIRIISTMQVFGQHYIQGVGYKICIGQDNDCPYCKGEYKVSPTYFCWVIDRGDNDTIKEAKFSYTVLKSIDDVTAIEEYGFKPDASGIFPYDINIRMIDGKKKGEKRSYNILPGERIELSEEMKAKIKELKHPMEMVKEVKDKAMADEGKIVQKNDEGLNPASVAEAGTEEVIEPPKDKDGRPIDMPF